MEEALKIGADAVSIHVNVGAEDESRMLSTLGEISRHCQEWGMPLLAMMYPRGRKIKDEYSAESIAHAARVGAELGADIVKTNYSGDPDSFASVVDSCPVPVVIAGGPKVETELDLLLHGGGGDRLRSAGGRHWEERLPAPGSRADHQKDLRGGAQRAQGGRGGILREIYKRLTSCGGHST